MTRPATSCSTDTDVAVGLHDSGDEAEGVVLVAGAAAVGSDRHAGAAQHVQLALPPVRPSGSVTATTRPSASSSRSRLVARGVDGADQLVRLVVAVLEALPVRGDDGGDVAEQVPLVADGGSLAVGEGGQVAVIAERGGPRLSDRVDARQRTARRGVREADHVVADDRLDEAAGVVVGETGHATGRVDGLDRQPGGVVADRRASPEAVDGRHQLAVGVVLEGGPHPVGIDHLDRLVGAGVDRDLDRWRRRGR